MKYLCDVCADHGIKPTGILHVGAAMLEEAEQYRDMGVKKVIWVEADKPSKRRQARAHEFGHDLFEYTALSDKREGVEFRVASNEASSSILPFARHSVIYPDIVVSESRPMFSERADEVFKDEYALPIEIDTLVLDVQGAELKVLRGMGKLLDQIKTAWLEINATELYTGCALRPDIEMWMRDKGFVNSDFQWVHQEEWGEELFWR